MACVGRVGVGRPVLLRAGPRRGRAALRGLCAVAIVGVWGALVFRARRLFGISGAYVSFILYVFSPTMLAHGAAIT